MGPSGNPATGTEVMLSRLLPLGFRSDGQINAVAPWARFSASRSSYW